MWGEMWAGVCGNCQVEAGKLAVMSEALRISPINHMVDHTTVSSRWMDSTALCEKPHPPLLWC